MCRRGVEHFFPSFFPFFLLSLTSMSPPSVMLVHHRVTSRYPFTPSRLPLAFSLPLILPFSLPLILPFSLPLILPFSLPLILASFSPLLTSHLSTPPILILSIVFAA
ncbi:hypothetical protein BLNAU_9841 [Blattamonas nauphoetae]|uniref:Uncharacterized protein n=1 Tax=Blattamonas nauphoetae TaxID=2049346 RepID=A0ABQ9XUE8_9EUKA|nr:hypothetical protein BLNAU_9841 [Blattamonas nauphoetae]